MKNFNFTKFVFFNTELNDCYEHLIYKGYEKDIISALKSIFIYISETDCLSSFKNESFNTVYFEIDNNYTIYEKFKKTKWKEYLKDYLKDLIIEIKVFEKEENKRFEYNHSFIKISVNKLDFFDRLTKNELKTFITFLMKKYKLSKFSAFILFKQSLKNKELLLDLSNFFDKSTLKKLYKNDLTIFENSFFNDMYTNWINIKREYANAKRNLL